MKKTYYIFTIALTAILFVACQNGSGVEKAEDMGKYAFDILKKFDNTSKEDYIKTIFTIEEVKEFGKKNADIISEQGKKEIANLTVEEYNGRMERDFNRIQQETKDFNIVWSEIEYSDYTYESREQDNIKGTRGDLIFKHNDITYTIKISALLVDNTYTLIRINRLNRK